MKTVLDKLINQDQKGFIAGRFIEENVIFNVLFETKNQNIPGMIYQSTLKKHLIPSQGNMYIYLYV